MKHLLTGRGALTRGMLAIALGLAGACALAAPKVGEPAPAFTAQDSNGRTVTLAGLAGKTVVMEWTNDGCPYVAKWYRSGGMQALQRDATARGAVWLTVASSAPGEQGHVDGVTANREMRDSGAVPTHFLLDPKGDIGRAYAAQVTPHMYVIAPDGTLAYMGGIDSIASADPADIPKAEPFARLAIEAVLDGRKVAKPVTRPYGCSVKYAN
ncbi:MAG: redoxin domain-containing protein [Gammaproteobacteria bacterium]|jgi:peroxiredoxin|nr:redoxin domain-containing protein [Gammaproteobacteria bacterium]MBU0773509.1 redoxin domain-containing protein [Gammaproteobacteria bacterium]MBU0857728.1 redoxin domain-containing protein [Gammaproteobacteria bacterium]MBU1848144.1 redoxin domain-containing protein [Gammaproteobacteria bacterium]